MQKLRFVPDDGKLGAMGTTYMDFSTGVFHVDGDAPLTQEQVDSVWHHLPTTGASWVERGNLFVQQFDGAKAFNLGPVERGVKGASDKVRFSGHSKRHHATKKKPPAQLQREIDEALAAQSGLSKHHRYLLSQRKPGGGLRAGYLTPSGWHGDPLAVEDPKLRLAALREQPAPRFPKEHHATMKISGWHIRQLPSGRRVVEKRAALRLRASSRAKVTGQ